MIKSETATTLKEEIAALVHDQTEDKLLLRRDHRAIPDAPERMSRVHFRALMITAHLNFYNQCRGEPYRHGVRQGCEWCYRKAWDELVERVRRENSPNS
jgi:hypothetical protein